MNMEAKVVFPPPPPTTNELTAQQRAQLVRTTRKIEQLLGTTPRLVDTSLKSIGPIHVTLPYGQSQRRLTKSRPRRSSVDSTCSYSSRSSSGSLSSPKHDQRLSSLSSNFFTVRNGMPSSRSSTSTLKPIALEDWVFDNTAPMLRLAMESLILESNPISPDSTQVTFAATAPQPPLHSRSGSCEDTVSSAFTLTPKAKETSSPRNSLVLSRPTIPSANSLRKKKMDRLRRKLGTGVPLELVFPKETDTGRTGNTSSVASANLDKECPPLPPPSQRAATKKATGRIASSRDSLKDVAITPRARRQVHTLPAGKHGITPKKQRSAPAPTVAPRAEFRPVKEKLSFIIESPDEHSSSCSGISRASTNDADQTSGWLVSSHDTEIKFWSTRKGYEGWNPMSTPSFNFSTTSTFTLSSSDDDGSSIEFASPTSRASAPVSPVSVEPLSTTQPRKRLPSYRKPPPPIPADCC